jgi:hypothetical protein
MFNVLRLVWFIFFACIPLASLVGCKGKRTNRVSPSALGAYAKASATACGGAKKGHFFKGIFNFLKEKIETVHKILKFHHPDSYRDEIS